MRFFKYKSYCFVIAMLVLFSAEGLAQDIHFSQFYNSPLTLNPAMTGLFKQDYRASLLYRSQWKQINAAFISKAFAGDINFIVNPDKSDRIGVGIFVLNDKIGSGIMNNNTALFSFAYHKGLDATKRHRLSVGLQSGYVQKSIDYSSFTYNSQFNNSIVDPGYDPSLASGEPLGRTNFNYVNLNAGVVWTFKLNEKVDLQNGVSFFNIIKPKESFVQSLLVEDKNKLKSRFTYSGTMNYKLSEKISLHPAVLVMTQTRVMDFNVGSSVGYSFPGSKGTMVQGGVWYRMSDAVVFMAGMRYKNWNLGVSYDKTTSGLNDVKKTPQVKKHSHVGAFEFTLTYYGFFKRPLPNQMTIPCRFF
jgi:type IX secretion system PorP/SprF family membrane protein